MNRDSIKKLFENMGSRLTIRTGTSDKGDNRPLRINVTMDKKGEHFTLTINPLLDESKVIIQALDTDKKHRQMLLNVVYWTIPEEVDVYPARSSSRQRLYPVAKKTNKPRKIVEKLLVGHDEMHWFVAGVTMSKTIQEAFLMLRPAAVTLAAKNAKLKNKDMFRHKTKGFIRQGEWFFVPVHFTEDKNTIIHKNEPINRQGGSPHIVEELVRYGGVEVWSGPGGKILSKGSYYNLIAKEPKQKSLWQVRFKDAKVLGRGKVKHRDHHTVILKGWHEIHLSTEKTANGGMNAFID